MKTATILVLIVSLTATAATKQELTDLSKKLSSGLNEMKTLADVYQERSFVIDGQEQVLDPNQMRQLQTGFYEVRSRLLRDVNDIDIVDVNAPEYDLSALPFPVALLSVNQYLGKATRAATLIEDGWKVTESVTLIMNTEQKGDLARKQAIALHQISACIRAIRLRKDGSDETLD